MNRIEALRKIYNLAGEARANDRNIDLMDKLMAITEIARDEINKEDNKKKVLMDKL
jgi:hypothetical protein